MVNYLSCLYSVQIGGGSIKSMDSDTCLLSGNTSVATALSAMSPALPSPVGTPTVISDEGCALMTAYLTEKAARETFIKQQQYRDNSCVSPVTAPI